MKVDFVLFCFLAGIASASASASASDVPVSGNTITLDFEATPVDQIFYHLAEFRQVNLVIAPGVNREISVRLFQVDWPQAVSLVAEIAGVHAELRQNILRVSPEPPEKPTEGHSGQPGKNRVPLKTRRFILRYTDVSEIRPLLQNDRSGLLSPDGRISLNSRANMLIVQDTESALADIAQWIKVFDVAIPQVEITAHIVTISEEQLHELGVQWGLAGSTRVDDILSSPTLNIPLQAESPFITAGMTLTRLNGKMLNLELSALEQENQVEIIASPRLITSHGNAASIKQGTEIPYVISQGKEDTATVGFKEAVLGMKITPEVLGEGNLRLTIHISQNVPGKALQKGNNVPLSIDKQEIETKVTIQDGQTLALGGIFQQHQSHQQNKVPGLAQLPAAGRLFRRDMSQQTKRELVIFITPRLIFP